MNCSIIGWGQCSVDQYRAEQDTFPFLTFIRILTHMQQATFENIVAKGDTVHNATLFSTLFYKIIILSLKLFSKSSAAVFCVDEGQD